MPARTYPVYSVATRHALAANIAALPVGPGQGWEVTIRRRGDSRSSAQNARFHALCRAVADDIGDSVDAVKAYYKELFLDPQEREVLGHKITIYPSTAAMDVAELARFMEQVEAHAASELGVFL